MTPHIDASIQVERPPTALDLGYFPFPVQFDLQPIVDFWRKSAGSKDFYYKAFLPRIEEILSENPFLLEPFDHPSRLDGFEEFLQLLFAPVLPHQGWSSALMAVCVPFMLHNPLFATPEFKALIDEADVSFEVLDFNGENPNCRTLSAYRSILQKYYKLAIPVDEPIITSFTNQNTGLCRYYKIVGNAMLGDVVNLAPLPDLTKHELQGLLNKPFNLDELEKMLPPKNFLFKGVIILTLTPVTVEESLSSLQYTLLEKRDAEDCNLLNCLQREMRNLFKQSRIRMGLATLQRNGELNFNSSKPLWNSLLLRQADGASQEWVKGSIYEKVLQKGQILLIEDLKKKTGKLNRAEQAILDAGYRNVLLAPLHFEGKQVGILELASSTPGDLHGLSLIKVNQVKPVFANAVKRHLEEFENRVEAAMLERYTAIHPTIQWRFREAAISLLDRNNGAADEEIVFENVFPFYGSLDIRDSSNKRNQAIVRDLLDNLETARNVLQHGYEDLSFAILGELVYETEQRLFKLRACFCTGDEVSLTEFIRREINPVVAHLRQHYPEIADSAKSYEEMLSPESGIFTRNRLAYEEALSLLNRTMVECLDEEETDLQRLFPCYFEKYKTDGVEYNIYIGAAIAPQHPFDPLYMDNLRLRQLLWTCKIMRRVNELQSRLGALLEDAHCRTTAAGCSNKTEAAAMQIAPLILSYSSPITLKFRMDEKRLDVDGSYNVRYEIVKKRIDKATVQGTKERLTQPEHIAIVYSRQQEASAYRRNLNYLAAQGMVQPEWEDLELEPMQGVDGLRALRVKLGEDFPKKTASENGMEKTKMMTLKNTPSARANTAPG